MSTACFSHAKYAVDVCCVCTFNGIGFNGQEREFSAIDKHCMWTETQLADGMPSMLGKQCKDDKSCKSDVGGDTYTPFSNKIHTSISVLRIGKALELCFLHLHMLCLTLWYAYVRIIHTKFESTHRRGWHMRRSIPCILP